MFCEKCGAHNSEYRKFCYKCAAALAPVDTGGSDFGTISNAKPAPVIKPALFAEPMPEVKLSSDDEPTPASEEALPGFESTTAAKPRQSASRPPIYNADVKPKEEVKLQPDTQSPEQQDKPIRYIRNETLYAIFARVGLYVKGERYEEQKLIEYFMRKTFNDAVICVACVIGMIVTGIAGGVLAETLLPLLFICFLIFLGRASVKGTILWQPKKSKTFWHLSGYGDPEELFEECELSIAESRQELERGILCLTNDFVIFPRETYAFIAPVKNLLWAYVALMLSRRRYGSIGCYKLVLRFDSSERYIVPIDDKESAIVLLDTIKQINPNVLVGFDQSFEDMRENDFESFRTRITTDIESMQSMTSSNVQTDIHDY